MKIGIGLPNQVRNVRPQVIPQWAAQAEQAGFSTLATVGRIAYPGVMDTVALAAAAGATSTIGLLSGVLLGPVWPARLLAKEVAGIDGVSGGRLTLGLGLGARADDFVVDGLPASDRGRRLDADIEVYRSTWRAEPVGDDGNPAVSEGSRSIPLLFGGFSGPKPFARMARVGEGYIGGSMPVSMVEQGFANARKAWSEAGREGAPRLVGIAYFALGDPAKGKDDVADYYAFLGPEMTSVVLSSVSVSPQEVKQTMRGFADIGADELVFNPTLDDLHEIERLAELVL